MANRYAPIVTKLQGYYPNLSRVGPTLDDRHIKRIETQLGYRLADDYREFLRDYGGIIFDNDLLFSMNQDGCLTEGSIFMFYGSTDQETLADNYLQGRRYFCLEDGYKWYPGLQLVRDISTPVDEMEWPEELLPIGSDAGGNEICLALFGLRPRAIFWWRNSPFPDAQNLYLIADSFDEFMQILKNMDE